MTGTAWVRRVWLFLLVCAAARVGAETLTVATYNLENYGPANRVLADGFHPSYPKPETEKAALRQVIVAMNADVLVLQEMGPRPYLEELRRDLKADGLDYPYAAFAAARDADRHVAMLSRRPLRDAATLDLPFQYLGGIEHVKRGLLVATVPTAAGDLTIFGVHLKSRLTERPDDPEATVRRMLEATAVRDAVLERFPDLSNARYLIIGDCNDTKGSKTVARLLRRGQTPISILLEAADAHGETWTYRYAREDTYSRIDHILVSPPLAPWIEGGKAWIFDGTGVMSASDHRPVYVRVVLPPR